MKYLVQFLLFILSLVVSLVLSQLFFVIMGFGLSWISSFNSIIMVIILYIIGLSILTFLCTSSGVGMTFVANLIRITLLRNLAIIGAILIALASSIIKAVLIWKVTDASISKELIPALVITVYSFGFVFYTIMGMFASKVEKK